MNNKQKINQPLCFPCKYLKSGLILAYGYIAYVYVYVFGVQPFGTHGIADLSPREAGRED
jgi:hypothetical protein